REMFFRRIDVSFEDRCVKSRSGDSRRETKELGFSLHRLADDDGTHAQARRQRAAAANISQTIAIGLALSDQAGEVADRQLTLIRHFEAAWAMSPTAVGNGT